MKLALNIKELDAPTLEVREEIENEIGYEVVEKGGNGILELTDAETTNFSQADIFNLGMAVGKRREKAIWTAPESLQLGNENAELLKQAMQNYAERSDVRVTGITNTMGQRSTEFTFGPQKLACLFGIFTEYGKLFERQQLAKRANEIAEAKSEPSDKCPECLKTALKEELDMFGGLCEECSGAFD